MPIGKNLGYFSIVEKNLGESLRESPHPLFSVKFLIISMGKHFTFVDVMISYIYSKLINSNTFISFDFFFFFFFFFFSDSEFSDNRYRVNETETVDAEFLKLVSTKMKMLQ